MRFLESGEVFLRHFLAAMGLDLHPSLGPTHLDGVALEPIRHSPFGPGVATIHILKAHMYTEHEGHNDYTNWCADEHPNDESQEGRHHFFFSDGNFFSTARLTLDFSPSVPWAATIASAIRAWSRSLIG